MMTMYNGADTNLDNTIPNANSINILANGVILSFSARYTSIVFYENIKQRNMFYKL